MANGRATGSLEKGAGVVPQDGSSGPWAPVQGALAPFTRGAVGPSPQLPGRRPTRDCPGREEGAEDPRGRKRGREAARQPGGHSVSAHRVRLCVSSRPSVGAGIRETPARRKRRREVN